MPRPRSSRMQSRFAGVLGGQQVMVRRVDLGAKGVYYRAMVGPFGNSDQASKLCSQAEGGGRLLLRPEDLSLQRIKPRSLPSAADAG